MRESQAATPIPAMRANGLTPCLAASTLFADDHGGTTIDNSRCIASGHNAARFKGRRQASHLGHGDVVHDVRVVFDDDGFRSTINGYRNRLFFEVASVAIVFGKRLRSERKFIGLGSADLKAAPQLLCGVGHRHFRGWIIEAHQKHVLQVRACSEPLGIDRAVLLHSRTDLLASVVVKAEWVLHGFGTTHDDKRALLIVSKPCGNHLCTHGNRLGAGATDSRDG